MGIDIFRLIAALLVVAIHTSPLASFSETCDFILTRIFARVAVPFFFMVSGYFTISRYSCNADKLKVFLKRTAQIYGIAMLIYVPINIYNGYFRMDYFLPNLIRDILIDGTLYHLWYLPASMLGSVIAWYLVKRLDYTRALHISFALYLVGMFGDSYYGAAERFFISRGFYSLIFQVMDYTRNGIFFAPIFFVIGGWIADKAKIIPLKKSICGFVVSLTLMFCEAMLLHGIGWQRFDSMYLLLIPSMFFLFYILLNWKGKRCRYLRTIALLIYLIHPMTIVIIHFSAKLLHLQSILIDNSLIYYLVVCFLSAAFAVPAGILWDKYKLKKKKSNTGTCRAWIEINLKNLEQNVKELQKIMPRKCEFMAVVKAEAYGHGAFVISSHLDKMGVKAFAVATIDEGIQLRKSGIRGEILILGYTDVDRASELRKYDLIQTLVSYVYASDLNKQGIKVKTHIKIDTGMHRLGIQYDESSQIKRIFTMENISICGLYTHLCCADSMLSDDIAFTEKQIERFYHLVDNLKNSGIKIPKLHIQSSYGLLNYPNLRCDYARIGIALYGVLSTPADKTRLNLDLHPVLSLKTKIVCIQFIKKGESFGYNRAFTAKKDSWIAILPIGYGDGFPRNLSCGNAYVKIHNQYAPVVGKICMDQLAVDITELENVSVGDVVTLMGEEEGGLSVPVVAAETESISNELLCRLGKRLVIIKKETGN